MSKAIIFDLGGVLFTNGTKLFINSLAKRYQLDPEELKIIFDGEVGSKYRESKIDRNEFWKQVFNSINVKESADELESEWINHYEIIPKTKEILFKLKKHYAVYYLSDNVKERVDKLNEKFGFLSWFTDGVFSYEVGVRKPNLEIYIKILRKFNLKPEECVFIDDKPKCLIPAKEIGFTTILFESPEQLEAKLQEIGLI